MSGFLKKPPMELPENQGTCNGSGDIREPIGEIIAAPARNVALVGLIEPTDESHDDEYQRHQKEPARALWIQAEKEGGKQAAAAKKEPEVRDFIDARDGR